MMKNLIMMMALLFVSGCAMMNRSQSTKDVVDSGWLYLEKDVQELPKEADSAYKTVNLPHTWNDKDTLKTKKYRRAASWYRKHFEFSADDLEKRLYLRFGAAGQRAVVYVNKKAVTEHIGGYSAFTVELTGLVDAGKNTVDVMVTNKHDKMIAPLSGDFNMYGGLYRSVELIKSNQICISKNRLAGPGFKVWSTNVSEKAANLKLSVSVDSQEKLVKAGKLKIRLIDTEENVVVESEKSLVVKRGVSDVELTMPKIPAPKLWSPESPNLYTVELTLSVDGEKVDQVTTKYGFRWFEFTADKGFFLNGKPYKLRGVNRHQDFYMKGNALTDGYHWNDLMMMKEIGVNWLRLAHYQQADYVLEKCDELGILVWEEIPYVNGTTFEAGYEKNLRSMMKDMITQHYNHPSIILWGMGNEVWMKPGPDGKAKCWGIINRLNDLIHAEDPVRKSVFVIGDANYAWKLKVMEIPDVIGYNLYRGWYGAGYETFTARCEDLHSKNPDKPFIVSEFGAGSDTRIHTETPKRYDFSSEYQVNFLESHLDQMDKMDWLCGFNWWNYADFGAAHRGDSIPHVNQKGFITFDRKKKDSFYFVKARWQNSPVLHIQGADWKARTGDRKKQYRVFTNLDFVEMTHNGQSLGEQRNGFVWDVNLVEGKNIIEVTGRNKMFTRTAKTVVTYRKSAARFEVAATGHEKGNPAAHAVDGKSFTRWSVNGNASITLDLATVSLVDAVNISFYKAKSRSAKFKVFTAAKAGQWVEQFSGNSNPKQLTEKVIFKDQAEARFIKIECLGNSANSWNSILEIEPVISTTKKKKNAYEKIGFE